MTDQEIAGWLSQIDGMSHEQMARLWRFARSGHPLFDSTLPLYKHFEERFDSLGGWTPEMSKRIGFVE